jgi:hypothetical protein
MEALPSSLGRAMEAVIQVLPRVVRGANSTAASPLAVQLGPSAHGPLSKQGPRRDRDLPIDPDQ